MTLCKLLHLLKFGAHLVLFLLSLLDYFAFQFLFILSDSFPLFTSMCVCVCMYVCMYVYIYIYIYIHTHTEYMYVQIFNIKIVEIKKSLNIIWPCWQGLEYIDCIPCERPPARGVLVIIINCIPWWGSSSGDLGSVKYPFIAITLRSTLTRSGSTC